MKAMKIITGIFVSLLVLTIATVGILSIWDIQFLSWEIIYKVAICGAIVGATAFVLWIIKHLFFKKGI